MNICFNVQQQAKVFLEFRLSRIALCFLSMLAVSFLNEEQVFSAQWSIAPTLRTEGQFHDNLRLTTLPHRDVWALKIKPGVGLTYATEVSRFKASPQYEYLRYFSDDPIEKRFNNFFLPLSGSYRTEVDRWGLDAAINRDNALISELEETGLVTEFIPRNYRNVRGRWDRSLTEQMTLQSSYQFTDVNYEQTRGVNLFDYQVHTGTIGADYQWTEKTNVHGVAWYSNYHVQENGFRSQSPGLELGFSHQLFETFSLSGSGGLRYVRNTVAANGQRQKDTNLTWLFDFSADKEWERSQLTLGYSRILNPSGLGVLFIRDRVNLDGRHRLSHALTVSLRGSFTNNDSSGSSSARRGVVDSQYWQVSPALSWRMTEEWSMDLSYRYGQRKFNGSNGGRAHSNTVNLALTYSWPEWSISR